MTIRIHPKFVFACFLPLLKFMFTHVYVDGLAQGC